MKIKSKSFAKHSNLLLLSGAKRKNYTSFMWIKNKLNFVLYVLVLHCVASQIQLWRACNAFLFLSSGEISASIVGLYLWYLCVAPGGRQHTRNTDGSALGWGRGAGGLWGAKHSGKI